MEHIKLVIAVLTDTKRKGCGMTDLNECVYSGVEKEVQAKWCVSILIHMNHEMNITN